MATLFVRASLLTLIFLAPMGARGSCEAELGGVRYTPLTIAGHANLANVEHFMCESDPANSLENRLRTLGLIDHPLFGVGDAKSVEAAKNSICTVLNDGAELEDEWRNSLLDFNNSILESWISCLGEPGLHFWTEISADNPEFVTLRVSSILGRGAPRNFNPRFRFSATPEDGITCPEISFGKANMIRARQTQFETICKRQAVRVALMLSYGQGVEIERAVPYRIVFRSPAAANDEIGIAECVASSAAADLVYQSVLNRAPTDDETIRFSSAMTGSEFNVGRALIEIFDSDESRDSYALSDDPDSSIIRTYRAVYGRMPDDFELDFYKSALDTNDSNALRELVESLVWSVEYQMKYGSWGIPSTSQMTYVCPF